jgi:hypothetical protein
MPDPLRNRKRKSRHEPRKEKRAVVTFFSRQASLPHTQFSNSGQGT